MSFARLRFYLFTLSGMALATLSSSAQPWFDAETVALMPVDELKPGMKGEVWTVFQGSQSEPFEVEVTGVIRNGLGPGKHMIVCELTDPRVQLSGAVAGMSGSPLYVDGKLVGALSYQLQRFETVRHAGFTPIQDILEVSRLPARLPPISVASQQGSAAQEFSVKPLQPVFSLSGLNPAVAALFHDRFSELGLTVAPLGGSGIGSSPAAIAPETAPRLQPGDAVAAAFATGDITIAGTGTVSYVDGEKVYAFGHPMLGLGSVELPMADAEIVTILPSQLSSFKVSNTGRVIGTISEDRLSAIYGELGRLPEMVPVEVTFPQGEKPRRLQFEVIRHRQITPLVAAVGLSQALFGSNYAGEEEGFKVTSSLEFHAGKTVSNEFVYPGPQGFITGLGQFVQQLTLWQENPYEKVYPEKISFVVESLAQNPQATLEQFQLSRATVSPGETVQVAVTWRNYQGEVGRSTSELPISSDWAGKDLEVFLVTGPTLDELAGRPRTLAAAQLRSFDRFLNIMESGRAADGLYLAVVERASLFMDQLQPMVDYPASVERIARASDEIRYQRKEAWLPLWEVHLLPGKVVNASLRRPLKVLDH